MRSAYGRSVRTCAPDARRHVVKLTDAELEPIDAWAIAAGMPHRLAALRHLIERGLRAERGKTTKRRGG